MQPDSWSVLREQLEQKKGELSARLDRIKANVRRGYDADSKERAKELEDIEVVDALGNETRREIALITSALNRMDKGDYGICQDCGSDIGIKRITAHPYADVCIECARLDEKLAKHAN